MWLILFIPFSLGDVAMVRGYFDKKKNQEQRNNRKKIAGVDFGGGLDLGDEKFPKFLINGGSRKKTQKKI